MSAVGIFILLLVAFVVLHRWYARPSSRARRVRSAGGHDSGQPLARVRSRPVARHARGEGAPGANLAAAEGTAGAAGALGAAGAHAEGGSHGGAGASGSLGEGNMGAEGPGGSSSSGGGSGNGGGNGGDGSGDGD